MGTRIPFINIIINSWSLPDWHITLRRGRVSSHTTTLKGCLPSVHMTPRGCPLIKLHGHYHPFVQQKFETLESYFMLNWRRENCRTSQRGRNFIFCLTVWIVTPQRGGCLSPQQTYQTIESSFPLAIWLICRLWRHIQDHVTVI